MRNFSVKVGIDASGSEKGARVFKRSADDIKKSSKSMLDQLKGTVSGVGLLKTALAGIGLGSFTAALKGAASAALLFSGAMAEVSTLLDGNVTQQTAELSKNVKELSVQFAQAPTTQAKALYQIISAGATTSAEAVQILTVSNKLAVGGITSVAIAADGLTSILNAYGLTADDSVRVSDDLFATMKAGKTTIAELSQSIGILAPTAAQLGVPLEQILAATATLTKNGISTQTAMAGLRQAFSNILKPTGEAIDAASNLSVEFSVAALQSKGLSQFLTDLRTQAGGSTAQLADLFGSVEATAVVMALAGTGAKSFADLLEVLESNAGDTETALDKVTASAKFQADQLKANVAVAFIGIGESLLRILLPAINALNASFDDSTTTGKIVQNTLKAILSVALSLSAVLLKNLLFASLSVARSFTAGVIEGVRYEATLFRMSVASNTAAKSFGVMAVASRGLAAAFSILTGPVGLILLGASAIFAFMRQADAAQEPVDNLAGKVDELSASFEKLGVEQRKAAVITTESLVSSLEDASVGIQQKIDDLVERRNFLASQIRDEEPSLLGSDEELLADFNSLTDQLTVLRGEFEGNATAIDEANLKIEAFQLVMTGTVDTVAEATELILAQREAQKNANAETEIYTSLGRAQAVEFEKLTATLFPLQALTKKYEEDLELLTKASKSAQGKTLDLAAAKDALREKFENDKAALKGSNDALEEGNKILEKLKKELDPVNAAREQFDEMSKKLKISMDAANIPLEEQSRLLDALRESLEPANRELESANELLDDLRRKANPAEAAAEDLQKDIDLLTIAFKENNVSLEDQKILLDLLRQGHEAASASGTKLAATTRTSVTTMEEVLRRSTERIDDMFTNLWESAFDGFKGFGKNLLSSFKSLLAELLNAALTRPITIAFQTAITGGASGVASAAGTPGTVGGGGLGSIASLGTAFGGSGAATGLFGGGGGSGANSGFVGPPSPGTNPISPLGQGLGGAAVGFGIGSAVGGLGSSIFGGGFSNTGSQIGGTIGGVAGSFIPVIGNIVGSIVGSILGGVIGGLFSGGPRVQLGGSNADIKTTGSSDGTFESAFGLNKLNLRKFDDETFDKVSNAVIEFDQIIANMVDDDTLGRLTDRFANFETQLKGDDIDFADLITERFDVVLSELDADVAGLVSSFGGDIDAQVQRLSDVLAIEDVIDSGNSTLGTDLVELVGLLDSVALEGETLGQTFQRVTAQMQLLVDVSELFDVTIGNTASEMIEVSNALVTSFGGLDVARQAISSFVSLTTTEAERAEINTNKAVKSVAAFNNAIGLSGDESIRTTSELREFVTGLDLTTEAGRQAFVAATQAAEGLAVFEQAMLEFENSTRVLEDFSNGSVLEDFDRFVEDSLGQSLQDQLNQASDSINSLVESYDGSISATNELAAATQNRFALELEFMNRLRSAQEFLNTGFDNLRERILRGLESPEETYERIADEAERLAATIPTLTDPEQIQNVLRQIEALSSQAFSLLSPEQINEMGQGFLDFLDTVEASAGDRLNTIESEFAESSQEPRDAIAGIMDQIRDPLLDAARDLTDAANDLSDAADALNPTDREVDARDQADGNAPASPPVDGGGGGGGRQDDQNGVVIPLRPRSTSVEEGIDTLISGLEPIVAGNSEALTAAIISGLEQSRDSEVSNDAERNQRIIEAITAAIQQSGNATAEGVRESLRNISVVLNLDTGGSVNS